MQTPECVRAIELRDACIRSIFPYFTDTMACILDGMQVHMNIFKLWSDGTPFITLHHFSKDVEMMIRLDLDMDSHIYRLRYANVTSEECSLIGTNLYARITPIGWEIVQCLDDETIETIKAVLLLVGA